MTTPNDDRELLALVLDPLEDVPVVALDASGNVVRWTTGAEQVLGHKAADVLSKHVSVLYVKEEVELGQPAEDLRLAAARGYVARDGWRLRADGERFWARTLIRSRRNGEGRLTGFVKLTCDLTDQLEIQRSLSASDQRLAALVELAVDGIVSTDETGRIILFNRGAELMFGYDRHEVVGEPLAMLLPERYREAHDRHMQAFLSGALNADRMAEGRIVTALTKDGREFPIEGSISRLILDDGAVLSVIVRDASERLAVERTLRDREARARQLADALPVPIHIVDRELKHVFGNRAVHEWLGLPPGELPGLSLREAAASLKTDATFEALEPELDAALGGEERRFSGRARHSDGSVRDVEILLVPSRDARGTVDGIYMVTLDRTEELRGEAARSLLTETGRLLGVPLDPEVTLHSAVRWAAVGFADRCTAFLERDDGTVLRLEARGAEEAAVPEGVLPSEVPLVVRQAASDGRTRSYTDVADRTTYIAAPLPCTERKGGTLVLGWAQPFDLRRRELEITEELARRLAGAMDRIELSQRSSDAVRGRDWLLHRVTHDLGNPVASIVMVADRLLRTAPEPDRRERTRTLLEGISQQAKQMQLIIQELLDASALRTGRASVAPRAVDAARVVREAVSLLEPIASELGVEIEAELPSRRRRVMADPYHLRQVLSALLSDQIGWSRPGARVRVGVAPAVGELVFEITGPGPGIPGDDIMRLLDEGPAGEDEGGSGGGERASLALLIGSEIVRAHGARLDVSGGDGETRYRFTLPTAR